MTGYGFECYRQSQELLQAAAAVGSSEDLNSSTLSVDGNDSTTADSSDSAGIAAGSSLLAILSSLRSRFAKTKRREILLRAREVVLADYHNTMLAAGDALEVSDNILLKLLHVKL